MVCVKAPGILTPGPPLQGLPELVKPETVKVLGSIFNRLKVPGFSEMKGLGAAANRSLLLSEQKKSAFDEHLKRCDNAPENTCPMPGGFEGEVPKGLVF